MKREQAEQRAELSGKATHILEARTLVQSHRQLAESIEEGMTVLDIGCGTGAITKDIASNVGPKGKVIGMDNNQALINRAKKTYHHQENLEFIVGNIYDLSFENTFDIVTCSRVLQWLSHPEKAIYG